MLTNLKRLGLGLVAALALALPAAAQTYDGDWTGVLEAGGQKLHLALHVKTEAGTTTAVLDSLDQGATIPSTAVKTENGEFQALFMAVMGELKGKLSADGKTLDGSWTQGATLPLKLTKASASAK